jgi:hypothetical protein
MPPHCLKKNGTFEARQLYGGDFIRMADVFPVTWMSSVAMSALKNERYISRTIRKSKRHAYPVAPPDP